MVLHQDPLTINNYHRIITYVSVRFRDISLDMSISLSVNITSPIWDIWNSHREIYTPNIYKQNYCKIVQNLFVQKKVST